ELPDDIHTPDHHFMLYQTIIAYEHRTETAYIITNNINDETEDEMKKLLQTISNQLDEQIPSPDPDINPVYFKELLTKSSFMEKVKQAKNHITNKEATQLALSQRMIANFDEDPFTFYTYLRLVNPSSNKLHSNFSDYLI